MPERKAGMKNTREDILDCARDLYLEEGLTGLSMRKVAKKVGVTPMAIYRHFENKEALQEQLLIKGFKSFGIYLNKGLEGKTPLERIKLTTQGYFDFATEQSKYFEIIFLSTDANKELKLKEIINKEAMATFNFLLERVQECIDAKIIKDESPFTVAVTILAEVNGLVSLYLTNAFGWTLEEFEIAFKKSLDRVIGGFQV